MNRIRARAEDGVALVVALFVMLIVFILATAILADAFHNVVGSAESRARLASINAAEAGVAWYTNGLEGWGLTDLTGSAWKADATNVYTLVNRRSVATQPGEAFFSVTATYSCVASDCPTPFNLASMSDTSAPTQLEVVLVSQGSAGTSTRSVRAELTIFPRRASLDGAFGGMFLCELGNRFTITGANADIYLQGGASGGCDIDSLVIKSGIFETDGSVYIENGSACIGGTTTIRGNLWANQDVRLGVNSSPDACKEGGSGGEVGVSKPCGNTSGKVLVCGDVVSRKAYYIKPGATVLGSVSVCADCPTPNYVFPEVSLAAWQDSFPSPTWSPVGHAPVASDFTVSGAPVVKTLFNVPASACAPQVTMPNKTLYLRTDVAVVAPCGFLFGKLVTIKKAPGVTGTPTLYLLTGMGSCSTTANNTAFAQNFTATEVNVYVYTPCRLSLTNQTNVHGQLLARQLYAQGNTTITAVSVLGLTGSPDGYIAAFSARVRNLREV